MAACTQGHEVLLVIGTALSGGFDEVDQCSLCRPSLPSAQFAEGVAVKKLLAGLPPGGSVTLVGAGITLVAFVGPCSLFRMFLAVPSFGEIGTAWMAARSLGLVGHRGFSLGQKESPGGIPELCMDLSECTVAWKTN